MKVKPEAWIVISIFFALFLFPRAAYAYIDPGTGSLIFQMIVAAGVGALFFLKVFWHRVKDIFGGRQKSEEHE